jgi:hypothetical protein
MSIIVAHGPWDELLSCDPALLWSLGQPKIYAHENDCQLMNPFAITLLCTWLLIGFAHEWKNAGTRLKVSFGSPPFLVLLAVPVTCGCFDGS